MSSRHPHPADSRPDKVPSRSDSYHYGPSPTPSAKAIPHRHVRPRRSWPPCPFVEDESLSLRREHNPMRHTRRDPVPHRGSIEQDPIIIDVNCPQSVKPQPTNAARGKYHAPKQGPTPPSSDDDKKAAARRRQRVDTLDTTVVPEMSRTPSPYHYSPSSNDSKYASTLGYTTPPPSAVLQKQKNYPIPPRSQPTSHPRPDLQQPRSTTELPPKTGDAEDRGSPVPEARSRRDQWQGPAPNITGASRMPEEPVPMRRDRPAPSPAASRPTHAEDGRNYADSFPIAQRQQVIDTARRPTPSHVSSLMREGSGQTLLSPVSSKTSQERLSSRSSSRASNADIVKYPPSPPRSPRVSSEMVSEQQRPSTRLPPPALGSATFSQPPYTPPLVAFASAKTSDTRKQPIDGDRTPLLPIPVRSGTLPDQWAAAPFSRKTESLPYPTNDFIAAMPEERDHQFVHDHLVPSVATPRVRSRTTSFTAATPTPNSEPAFTSATKVRQVSAGAPVATGPPATRPAAISLPPCPGYPYTKGSMDWYTIDGLPDFDVCPDCFKIVFKPTFYANHLRPVTRSRQTETLIRCEFSKPWYRFALRLTLQRQAPNLNVIRDLHNHLRSVPPCPNMEEEAREWYTMLDDQTRKPMRDFHICAADMRSIEILLPGLRGFWVPYPRRTSSTVDAVPRRCTLRSTYNNRFPIFLDSLITLHETAQRAKPPRLPDMVPFVQLVKHKLNLEECPRDNIMQGQQWFYIPSLPEFTVCEDCHDEIVVPLLRMNMDFAMRFNRKPLELPLVERGQKNLTESPTETGSDASCSLYSSRMRRYFMRAVEDDDLKYLSRKAKERKRKEAELQRKARPLLARRREINGLLRSYDRRHGHEKTVARLQAELEEHEYDLMRYGDEWADYE